MSLFKWHGVCSIGAYRHITEDVLQDVLEVKVEGCNAVCQWFFALM